jgi:hypothetical protein
MARLFGIALATCLASLASCTALLGLDGKTFGTGGGTSGNAGATSTSHTTTTSTGPSSSSASSTGSTSSSGGPCAVDAGAPKLAWVNYFDPAANGTARIGAADLDPSGNLVAVGWIRGSPQLGACGFATASGAQDGFVVRLTPDQKCTYAPVPAADMSSFVLLSAVVPETAEAFVAGNFAGHVAGLAAQGSSDAFVAHMTATSLTGLVAFGNPGSTTVVNHMTSDADTLYVFGGFAQYLRDSMGNVLASGGTGGGESGYLLALRKVDLSVKWAVAMTAAMGGQPLGAAMDPTGAIVLGGLFTGGNAKVGSLAVPATGANINSAFVARIGNDGGVIDAVGDATSTSAIAGVAADPSGTIYVGGNYTGSLALGGLMLAGDVSATRGFVATFDPTLVPTGSRVATPTKGPGSSPVFGFTRIVPGCPTLVAGEYQGSVAFSPTAQETAAGGAVFVAAYDPTLAVFAWEESFLSPDLIGALGVVDLSVDRAAGAIYLSGAYKTSITVGATAHVAAMGNMGASFIAKLVLP